jgi:hypothetical protein
MLIGTPFWLEQHAELGTDHQEHQPGITSALTVLQVHTWQQLWQPAALHAREVVLLEDGQGAQHSTTP